MFVKYYEVEGVEYGVKLEIHFAESELVGISIDKISPQPSEDIYSLLAANVEAEYDVIMDEIRNDWVYPQEA